MAANHKGFCSLCHFAWLKRTVVLFIMAAIAAAAAVMTHIH